MRHPDTNRRACPFGCLSAGPGESMSQKHMKGVFNFEYENSKPQKKSSIKF